MLGPYVPGSDRKIHFRGNRLYKPIDHVCDRNAPTLNSVEHLRALAMSQHWAALARICHQMVTSSNVFFNDLGALYAMLPLTTRMISSPGAVFGREKIDYTTDTCPITLQWFDLSRPVFLSESSQIYLELMLLQPGIESVYSIYNSFRKERTDSTHLSEFHHIEFEGHVDQMKNVEIAIQLVRTIIKDLLAKNDGDLAVFLTDDAINELSDFSESGHPHYVTFREALDVLYKETKDDRYKDFTCRHFGAWEEVLLTHVHGGMVVIKEYPLFEVPFYHDMVVKSDPPTAENADVIWPGYRETIGSGHRISSIDRLNEKAQIFNLPAKDYAPYMQSRKLPEYRPSSGFGLGCERFLQGLLMMPFIWDVAHFPRMHTELHP